jgi:V/A-type H+/Na+-transporting ATPase subunit I
MSLKPAAARWFELLTDRESLGDVLSSLAGTGLVELQAKSAVDRPAALPDYRELLTEFADLARRYRAYWPEPRIDPAVPPPESIAGARDVLGELRSWAAAADPCLARLQSAITQRAALAEFSGLLELPSSGAPVLELAQAGDLVESRLYALGEPLPPLPSGLLTMEFPGPNGSYLAALGTPEDCAALDHELELRRGRRLQLPAGLDIQLDRARAQLSERVAQQDAAITKEKAALDELASRYRLPARLAGFAFLNWLVAHVPRLAATEHFAWVTGWTGDLDGTKLEAALARAGLPHLLHFPEAPPTFEAPVLLVNPTWLRPFELFVRLLGTPRAGEADPTAVLAVLAPLLFGFMFGDVVQGAVLLVAGVLLWRRVPALRLLVPGGISAIAFGFAFGSVAARDDLIRSLWVHPLAAPLVILTTTVIFGVVVLLGGMTLDALEHFWRGQGRDWLWHRGGLAVAYLGFAGCLFSPRGLLLSAAGLAWALLGPMVSSGSGAEFTKSLGESIETLLQLGINTISFARVGAFALAHAGLSAAIVGVAVATHSPVGYGIILVLGNVLILILEGLVVAIQTTRLVLFEFFIRFLRADGRPLRPLPPPPGTPLSR